MSNKKYFPIQTTTSCRLKWSYSTLFLNSGVTASCHRASVSNFDNLNFENFHNTPVKIADRQAMLDGKWPGGGCEHCRDTESANGFSDRQFQNNIPDVYPVELDSNQLLTSVNPAILEIFFKNTCNLSCLYCNESFSSKIAHENKKYGQLNFNNSIIQDLSLLTKDTDYKENVNLFWKWMDTGYKSLKRLMVLGGEPFIQPDFYKLLDYIDSHPNPNLEFSVITNLIIKKSLLEEFCSKITERIARKKVRRIEIIASIDCWGKEQEYIRNGFDCNIFEENFQYLLLQPHLRLSIMSTVTSLSLNSMPALVDKFNEWNKQKEIYWQVNNVLPFDTNILRPAIFDSNIFKEAFDQIILAMPTSTYDQKTTKELMLGIISQIHQSASNNYKDQQQLFNFLTEIDNRRNLNWTQVFPWLEREFKKCGIIK